MFRDDIGTRPKAIGDLLASDEISAAQRSAHSLSGAALHLGAMKLAETARQFELIDTDADRLIHELLRIAGETVAAIDHYRITMAAQPTSKAQ